jgi:hypothetical protein
MSTPLIRTASVDECPQAPAEGRVNCLSVAFLLVELELGFAVMGWLLWRLM